jgi:hypothetical protein
MTSGRTPTAAFTPRLRERIAWLLVAAAGALLMGHRCQRALPPATSKSAPWLARTARPIWCAVACKPATAATTAPAG